MARALNIGDAAPDIPMRTHTGETISLADYRGSHPVVLFFYPKSGSPICTKEACSFRDAHQDFAQHGAVLIGVSGDSLAGQEKFAGKYRLPYLLVADNDGAVRRAFGVPKVLGMLSGRVTYVIDRDGVVRHVFESQLASEKHVAEALDAVNRLDP